MRQQQQPEQLPQKQQQKQPEQIPQKQQRKQQQQQQQERAKLNLFLLGKCQARH